MDVFALFRAIASLSVVLGLVGLTAWAARRWAPLAVLQAARPRTERRLAAVESLTLDPQRRLVLVRLDGAELLLLLGEGRLLDASRTDGGAPR